MRQHNVLDDGETEARTARLAPLRDALVRGARPPPATQTSTETLMTIVDIHPHIISDDETLYPPAPLFGKRSDWSQERPNTVEALIAAMDEAGVAKAAVVQQAWIKAAATRNVDGAKVLAEFHQELKNVAAGK